MNVKAYLKLMRFHKPTGILLLWLPTAWALWIANKGAPSLRLGFYFLAGTILMRAAGCVINDIADRNIDRHVQRTQARPLTNGDISLPEALALLVVLLFFSLTILIQLPIKCFIYGLIAFFITILYPFCKRFLHSPQIILGLAFSMGIPIAYVASGFSPDLNMTILFVLNFIWIIAYDTMYAMADREDDLRIGVRSTAIYFASWDCTIIAFLQTIIHGLWIILAVLNNYNHWFYLAWTLSAGILVYQQYLLRTRTTKHYLLAFASNNWYGLIMWLGLIVGNVTSAIKFF